ncbi:MAG: 30S ribosomal protein S7 [Candidatus Pacearchaeota archaeon]|nr:30S ribosomal protein S7 [Candidatus Pacearchaeota archaeon]
MKIFDKYTSEGVVVNDLGLKPYINLAEKLVLKTHGRHNEKFGREKINIMERLALLLGVPGHRGKKHKIQTSWASGKYNKNMKTVMQAFKILEKSGNPIQILVKAVENSSPCDEVTTIEYGGARYPQSVDVSPMRRINLALRNLVHGAYDKAFNKKTKMYQALANELLLASNNSNDAFAVQKKTETEKQADAAR